jgi:hypothetical protein
MEGEAGILQQRVEAVAVGRRRHEAEERVRGEQNEGEEGDADQSLHRERPGAQRGRQVDAEGGERRAEQRQDQHPEQHRALVVAPDAAHLVDHRLGRVRILGDQSHREIRHDERPGQRHEGDQHEQELGECRRPRQRHQARLAARCAHERQRALHDGDEERQHQRELADLGDHWVLPSCHLPAFLSASTTSRGI